MSSNTAEAGTVREAVDAYRQLDEAGSRPSYYGGGTELISMARAGSVGFGAVVDIKSIPPKCRTLDDNGEVLNLGAALTLGELAESDKFPAALAKPAGADRRPHDTMQDHARREPSRPRLYTGRRFLPLLLADAVLTAAGPQGLKKYHGSIGFKERLLLPKGEFIVGAAVARAFAVAPYYHEKNTKNEKIDYPF